MFWIRHWLDLINLGYFLERITTSPYLQDIYIIYALWVFIVERINMYHQCEYFVIEKYLITRINIAQNNLRKNNQINLYLSKHALEYNHIVNTQRLPPHVRCMCYVSMNTSISQFMSCLIIHKYNGNMSLLNKFSKIQRMHC